jgi:cytoskeletal protein RodZ
VSVRLGMVRGALVVVCALAGMALGVQWAHAEPKPETPPQSHRDTSLQPVSVSPQHSAPAKSGSATTSTSATTSSPASRSDVSTSTSSTRRAVVTTRVAPNATSAPSTPTASTQRHTAPPKRDLAPLFELRVLGGLRELPSAASSSGSGLLLAAGFALVLLVIAETSFLGLAASRLGLGDIRAPSKQRSPDEPLAIRRVQLRR